MRTLILKICTKCGDPKPITEFYKSASNRDGLLNNCKVCNNISSAKYRAANRENVSTYNAKYRASHPEKLRTLGAQWFADNPERKRAINTKWRAANPEKVKSGQAKHRAANREKLRADAAKWQKENPEACRINNQNRHASKLKVGGKLSKGLTEKLFKLQRGKCPCCKQPLGDKFHLDHIVPLALGGTNTDDNIQLLRSTCNMQKSASHPVEFMQSRGFLL